MKRHRSGFSLIEVMVTISIFTVLLAATGSLMHVMLRTNRRMESSLDRLVAVERLTVMWRTDVHRASKVSASTPDSNRPMISELSLETGSGERIAYRRNTIGVERTVERNGVVTHRDEFRIGECHRLDWLVPKETHEATVKLIAEVRSIDGETYSTIAVYGAIGLDLVTVKAAPATLSMSE